MLIFDSDVFEQRFHATMEQAKALASTPAGQLIIKAVRADEVVGEGTCTHIDEAHEDHEVIETLCNDSWNRKWTPLPSPEEAVKRCREVEELIRGCDSPLS